MKRVVLVTGVAGGIGQAIAVAFAEDDWTVVGVDNRDLGDPLPSGSRYLQANVASPAEVEGVISDISSNEGRLDAVVNNAAVQVREPLAEIAVETWDYTMQVNVRAAFLTVRSALPLLGIEGGAVVNVGSVHAIATVKHSVLYAASKGALLALTRAMAIELAPINIRVNAVTPGAVDTPMLSQGPGRSTPSDSATEGRTALIDRTPLRRIGRPSEIARAILFLCDGEESSFITGESLVVDGGATVRLGTE